MHFKGLDLNLLVVLDALLNEKNTTKAGQRIYLSQSATSGALARLREFFGDPLLVQSGQKMVLTPLAEGLVGPVQELLREAEGIISVNAAFQPATSTRTFRLNMSDYSATVIMTSVLRKIREVAPGIHIEITSVQELPSEALERGDLDFLIVPSEFKSPLHPAEDLFEDEYVVVAWSGNRNIHKSISLEQYFSTGHVIARYGRGQTKMYCEASLNRMGYQVPADVVVPALALVPEFVVGSDLIATMHARYARYYARFLPLKTLPVPLELPHFVAQIQWHRYHDHDPGTRWLHGIIKKAAEEEH